MVEPMELPEHEKLITSAFNSGFRSGYAEARDRIFKDLFSKVGFDGHNVSIFKNELIEIAKKYGVTIDDETNT